VSSDALGTFSTVDLPSGPQRILDVSVLVSEFLPSAWPGSMMFAHKSWNWFTDRDPASGQRFRCAGPYATNFLIMDEHTGTHLDGPTHFLPPADSGLPHASPLGAVTGDQLDLATMAGPASVLDMRRRCEDGQPGMSPAIRPADLLEWERVNGTIDTPVVLLRTGWDRYYVEDEQGSRYLHAPLVTKSRPGWPAPNVDAMALLRERRVRLVGTDGPSMGACHDGAPVHWAGLESGMLFVEVLCRLGELPARGSWFQFLPIKVAGSTGGPGRAIVFLPA
jgi:kynurenine formamidase